MMTKQAELKKQAYASTLKSRALSVLIYLIDRSNNELTCFPAIPTMAEQLHISVSTVKRALHELLDSGYIKKDARFREKNKGQTSNLYTLVLLEGQLTLDDSQDFDCDRSAGTDQSGEFLQEKEDETGQEIGQVEHISFEILKKQKEDILETQMKEVQKNTEGTIQQKEYQEIRQNSKIYDFSPLSQMIKRFFVMGNGDNDFPLIAQDKGKLGQTIFSGIQCKFLFWLWTGVGVSLMPP